MSTKYVRKKKKTRSVFARQSEKSVSVEVSWRKWSKLQGLHASRVVSISVSISASADPEPPRAQAATLQLHAFSLRVCARARAYLCFLGLSVSGLGPGDS